MQKLLAKGIEKSIPVPNPVEVPAAPKSKSSPKGACPPDKIKNPNSQRCVDIKGAAGKNIIKDFLANNIELLDENVKKLKALGISKPSPTKSIKPLTKTKAGPSKPKSVEKKEHEKIPDKVKNKLLTKLDSVRKRLQFPYINEDHREKCLKNLNKKLIAKSSSMKMTFTFDKIANYNLLNDAPLQFTKMSVKAEIFYNQYNKDVALRFPYDVDMDWFKKSDQYVKGLTLKDFHCIKYYTGAGDKMINGILRNKVKPTYWYFELVFFQCMEIIKQGKFDKKKHILNNIQISINLPDIVSGKFNVDEVVALLHTHSEVITISQWYNVLQVIRVYLKQAFWIEACEMYIKDLNEVIKKSPPVTKEMTVYRGVKNDYFLKGSKNAKYTDQGFISTSLSSLVSIGFMGYTGSCCMTRIKLMPGTHAVFIAGTSGHPTELEVLLPRDTEYHIEFGKKTEIIYSDRYVGANDVCGRFTRKVYVTNVVVKN